MPVGLDIWLRFLPAVPLPCSFVAGRSPHPGQFFPAAISSKVNAPIGYFCQSL